MTTQKRDLRGKFQGKTKAQRISDNGTKIICNALWVVCVVSVAAILTASSLDLTEVALVALAGGARLFTDVIKA